MARFISVLAGLALALSLPAPRASAQPGPAPVAQRDGQRDFDWEIGTWTTKVRVRRNPLSGEAPVWVEYQGTSAVKTVSDGRANLVELSVSGPKGKIEGVSLRLYNPEARQWSLNFASYRDGMLTAPVALQPWYNLVEREKYEGLLQTIALEKGLSVFPYYSLANGFLTGKYRSRDDLTKSPRGLRNVEYLESDRGRKVLAALEDVSAETGAAMATVALAWLKDQPGITAPIASATSAKQAEELVAALMLDLTPGQVEQLNLASE